MCSVQRAFTAMAMVALLVACTNEGKVDQSLKSVMAQSVANALTPSTNHHVTNLSGHFQASVDGVMSGNHWDASGRRYSPQLMLGCFKRESDVLLRFSVPFTSTTPLPARGDLRAIVALDGGVPRTMTLTRAGSMYRIEGALPLVRELLAAERVRLDTMTADNLRLSAQFDLRGLKGALPRYDFYCADSWLAAEAPQPQPVSRIEITRAAPAQALDGDAIMSLERLRAEAKAIDGVTSTAWLPDRTLMLGMGNTSAAQRRSAARQACELMRDHPEVRQQVEIQDTHGAANAAQRLACPR